MKNNLSIAVFLLFTVLSLAFLSCSQEESTPTVTSVTVNPPSPNVAKGGILQFSPIVTGTNNPAQTVTWSIIETGRNSGTTINSGLLTVDVAETLTTLTVKATSTLDPSKSGTANVKISGTVTVSSVMVNPASPSVRKGTTQNFTATVIGTNNPAQTVTWAVTGGVMSGTSIATNGGTLTVAFGETASTLTVTATSTFDNTKKGTVTVALLEAISTTPLDKNATGVQTFTSNSGGNKQLTGSSYGYEMWTEGGNNNKLIWFGLNQGGGAAFRAEWNNPNDFLGRVGYYWGNGGQFTTYKNIYADFNYTRSGTNTAGNYSYIGIYGWARNPSAAKEEEKLIEYYIVEDWFGNQWQADTSPMGTSTTGGSEVGSGYTLDGATYKVIKNVRNSQPSIDGTKTFTQYFSIRQTLRKTGTISVTEHYKKWDALGMKLGNMYECKFLVEAGGGTGWLEFTWLKFSQEANPR